MSTFRKSYPHQLSGGELQRVALARTLILEPKILLLDEALADLDLLLKKDIFTTLLELHSSLKFTLLYVTHNQEDIIQFPSKIIVMSQGKIEQIGTLREILDTPHSRFVQEFINPTLFPLLPADK